MRNPLGIHRLRWVYYCGIVCRICYWFWSSWFDPLFFGRITRGIAGLRTPATRLSVEIAPTFRANGLHISCIHNLDTIYGTVLELSGANHFYASGEKVIAEPSKPRALERHLIRLEF